jgi:hypothetical protein
MLKIADISLLQTWWKGRYGEGLGNGIILASEKTSNDDRNIW